MFLRKNMWKFPSFESFWPIPRWWSHNYDAPTEGFSREILVRMGMISKFRRVVSTWKIEKSIKWKFLAGKIIETSNAEWWISNCYLWSLAGWLSGDLVFCSCAIPQVVSVDWGDPNFNCLSGECLEPWTSSGQKKHPKELGFQSPNDRFLLVYMYNNSDLCWIYWTT